MLAEERRKEREYQQMLEKQEEINLGLNQSFPNLQQEVDFKTKKLKKYFSKLQALKQEIKDLNETNSKQRQELEQNQTDLLRDIKLRQLIIDNFIPKDEKEKLITRLYYDPDEDRWKPKSITKEKFAYLYIKFVYSPFKTSNRKFYYSTHSEQELQMAKRPISAYGMNRAMTNYARNAARTLNPRFLVKTSFQCFLIR